MHVPLDLAVNISYLQPMNAITVEIPASPLIEAASLDFDMEDAPAPLADELLPELYAADELVLSADGGDVHERSAADTAKQIFSRTEADMQFIKLIYSTCKKRKSK